MKIPSTFEVIISTDSVKERLKKIFEKAGEDNAVLLAEHIVNNLAQTETGINHLLKCMLGEPEIKYPYVEGDEVKFSEDLLYSWSINKEIMRDNGEIVKGMVKATVKEIDIYKKRPIIVEFKNFNKDGKAVLTTQDLSIDSVFKDDECLPARQNLADMI